MKKNILIWQVAGATFTAVLGTILHFLFQWTELSIFAPFSAVNESTWEHMKLIFIPSFIFAIIQSFFFNKDFICFWFIKFIGIVIGTLSIPTLFYTLGGAFGELLGIVNISIFFVSVFIQYGIEYYLFSKTICVCKNKWIYLGALIFVFALFVIFTFFTPKIPLFLDPLTKTYGILK